MSWLFDWHGLEECNLSPRQIKGTLGQNSGLLEFCRGLVYSPEFQPLVLNGIDPSEPVQVVRLAVGKVLAVFNTGNHISHTLECLSATQIGIRNGTVDGF